MTEIRIASPANPRVKAAARLRDRRERERTQLTLVDGGLELRRALDAGVAVEEAYVCPALVRTPDARAAVEMLAAVGATVTNVSQTAFAKLAFGERLDGVLAVIRAPATPLARILLPERPLIVVLEGVEKPGNVGAVLRSADGAGANALVIADPRTDLFNPNAIRASIGTIFTVPLAADSTPEVRSWLASQRVRLVSARVDGPTAPWDVDLTGAVAVVLGSEAEGLSGRWAGDDVTAVRIPMRGIADSLNVSVAAAVLLYEARRQRG